MNSKYFLQGTDMDLSHLTKAFRTVRRPGHPLTLLALGIILLHLSLCLQAVGQSYSIDWHKVSGGGGTSSGGLFTVSGTAGQPDAGTLTGGNFRLEGGFWTGVQVLQVPRAPILKIKLVGTNAVVSWPLNITGFSLEETAALNSGVWGPTPQSVVDTATEHTVTVPAAGVIKCFRLKYP